MMFNCWLRCASVWFSCTMHSLARLAPCHSRFFTYGCSARLYCSLSRFGGECEQAAGGRGRWYWFVCVDPLGVLGALSLVVLHPLGPCAHACFLAPRPVAGVDKRHVNVADGIRMSPRTEPSYNLPTSTMTYVVLHILGAFSHAWIYCVRPVVGVSKRRVHVVDGLGQPHLTSSPSNL